MDLYPLAEELANALTHGIGVVLFSVLTPLIISFAVQTKNMAKIIGACFFSFGILSVYTSSTIFHAIPYKFTKDVLLYFDMLSIYLLIAGTYTAFILVFFKDKFGYTLLTLVWLVSLTGIALSVFWPNISATYSLVLYLLLGWTGVILIKPSLKKMARSILFLILAGGIAYTIGTYFFALGDQVKYYHAIWHLFVLLGSLLHWTAVTMAIRGHKQTA